MAGRFEGLMDAEWELFRNIFPSEERRGCGRSSRSVTQFFEFTAVYPVIVGCRRCDLPLGPQWVSKSASHRRLKLWHDDGTLKEIKARLLGLAQNEGLICWNSGAADGFFPSGKGGGAEAAYGYKGEGVLVHLFADADGMPLSACSAPANKDERKHAGPLLEMVAAKTGKPGRPPKKLRRIAADKGYDSDALRDFLKSGGIQPQIPRKKNAGGRRGRPVSMNAPRFQVERTFSWLQRKFRRLVVRWERLPT